MTPKSTKNPSKIHPKLDPESKVVFLLNVGENWTLQTLKTYVFLKENNVFPGSALFASILIFIQKTSRNQVQNRSKINQKSDQKNIQ